MELRRVCARARRKREEKTRRGRAYLLGILFVVIVIFLHHGCILNGVLFGGLALALVVDKGRVRLASDLRGVLRRSVTVLGGHCDVRGA